VTCEGSVGCAAVRLRVATCRALPKVDPDAVPLAAALSAAGVEAQWLAWDDPEADWDAPVPTVVRSTWNYALDRDAFLAWAARAARGAPLWNPPDILVANTHKRYLLDLAARGVPVVPTVFVERGEPPRVASRGWTRVVVKPAVGAGSLGARAFDAKDPAAEVHAEALAARGELLIQPYLDSVHDYGERSLVWIDGELSHAVRKSPRFAGDGEQVTGPLPIAEDERAVALDALGPIADRILYGRVDIARDAGGAPVLMELELTEPSLFLAFAPGAAERYVRGLVARLR
jgi:glutathione synthase/RimK-type ligase-like ATP-grasp enzyme